MEARHDLRRNDRHRCDHKITVMWRDLSGQDKFVHAKALDISEFGLRIQMPEALPNWTYLALNASKLGLTGHASVRHCARTRDARYAVGLEFTAGLRWTPTELTFTPACETVKVDG
jgi:hypothetical protein